MRHRLGGNDRVGFRVFTLGETLDAWVIADGTMGRLHQSPRQVLGAILGVATPFPFAIPEFLAADTATRGGKVADRGKASDIPRFEPNGEREDLPNATHRGVRFFRNDTINSSFPVPSIALFGQPFFPPGTSFKGTRTEGISANVAW